MGNLKNSNKLPCKKTTLHDFFPPKSSTPKQAIAKDRQGSLASAKETRKQIPPCEVIVLDSDDEEAPMTRPAVVGKKRKLSESSDGIEFVDDVHRQTPMTHGDRSSVEPTKRDTTSVNSVLASTVYPSASRGLTTKSVSYGPPISLESQIDSCATAEDPLSEFDMEVDIDMTNEPAAQWEPGDDEITFNKPFREQDDKDIPDHPQQSLDSTSSSGDGSCRTSSATTLNGYPPLNPAYTPCGPPQKLRSIDRKTTNRSNAFSLLMSSNYENEAWKEASAVEDHNFRPTKDNGGRRKAPFYKVLQGMPIAVDAFRYGPIPGVTAYFLSHAHSDHYTNLSSNWNSGPIYCSEGTGNLIIHMLSVDRKWVRPLPMDIPTIVPNTGGVRVTLIEANHCPGSCLFLFEGQQTVNAGDSNFKSTHVGSNKTFRFLHCGDFRASPQHVLHPAIKGKWIDHVYLDTTYLDPKYTFPPQPLVIDACVELAKRIALGQPTHSKAEMINTWISSPNSCTNVNPNSSLRDTLFVVGTYSIGKERIVKAIAHALGTKVYCDKRKATILRCQADPELHALLTSDPLEASVHLVPLGMITSDKLKTYVEKLKGTFRKAVAFRPTGWTYTQPAGADQFPSIAAIISHSQQMSFTYTDLRPGRNSTPALQLFPVPYSEHSSFFELTCFAMSLRWGKMIATVNIGNGKTRGKMSQWIEKWRAEQRKGRKDQVVPYRRSDYW